jgi:hypothetical protein
LPDGEYSGAVAELSYVSEREYCGWGGVLGAGLNRALESETMGAGATLVSREIWYEGGWARSPPPPDGPAL